METNLKPGTRIGSYEVLSLVGAGGMGEVYRARDTRLKRDVALKVLRIHPSGEEDSVSRFEREARVVAALSTLSHFTILAGMAKSHTQ
jgi:eukaryotic-like serine/threonine-protein kinase